MDIRYTISEFPCNERGVDKELTPSAQKLIAVLKREQRSEIDLTVDRELLASITRRPRWLLSDMHARGLAHPVQRGRYLVNLNGQTSERATFYALDPLAELVLRRLDKPYYLSWHSALWHYGLLDQQSNKLCVAVTFRKRPVHFETFDIQFVTVRPRKFFGFTQVQADRPPSFLEQEGVGNTRYNVATVEKTFIDAFDRPDLSSPMAIVADSLKKAWRSKLLDPDLLVKKALQFNSPYLNRRLGFFMELWEIPGSEELHEHIGRTSAIVLDPGSVAQGAVDRSWLVYKNPFIIETAKAPRG